MPNANLYFKFVDSASKAGKTGLTVTADVFKLTKSGAKTTVATGAACAEVGGGVYAYNLSSQDFATYDYVATASPSDATGLTNADADSFRTLGDIAYQVWVSNPAAFVSGSIGYTLNNRITSIKTKTDALSDTPAADVWEILTADHSTTGTFGAAMAAAGTAGDPWTTPLPGAYGPGTAGYIVGHFSSGVTVDLSAVVSAQAIAQAALVRIQAAVYDTARVCGNVIFMSDGHTQRMTAGGRQTV